MVAMARFARSGINPAATQRVGQCLLGAGFTTNRHGALRSEAAA
jgi:hypothetical protein